MSKVVMSPENLVGQDDQLFSPEVDSAVTFSGNGQVIPF